MTYPVWYYDVAYITQHRGNLSQIEKLLRVIDYFSRYAVVLVCLITFVFFKFFLRQSVLSAILNIVRLICKAAVPNLPNDVATRIYLSGLFIFVVTLQGIYQEKLASLLTKPMTRQMPKRLRIWRILITRFMTTNKRHYTSKGGIIVDVLYQLTILLACNTFQRMILRRVLARGVILFT